MLRPVHCPMSRMSKPQAVEISGTLRYGASHNHIVVLGPKAPEIIILEAAQELRHSKNRLHHGVMHLCHAIAN